MGQRLNASWTALLPLLCLATPATAVPRDQAMEGALFGFGLLLALVLLLQLQGYIRFGRKGGRNKDDED